MIPRATYRIQFHAGFGFDRAAALAGYLRDLGISHLYASPIATARAGSTHGYDVIDPTTINPELGGETGFRTMAAALRAHGIGIILDIVPNHMAVGGDDNPWWLDVLARGAESPFASHFDIDWFPLEPRLHGKLLAPFLGQPYGEALSSGALLVTPDGGAVVAHGVHRFPLRAEDRAAFPDGIDPVRFFDPHDPEGAARLHALLDRQHYRLAWWRTAADEINWRRFFDITELAGLRVEDEAVFDAVHALPLRLYGEGLIDGVRVDHVDGLADPAGYIERLREAMNAARDEPGYLVVEKILAGDEALAPGWATDGTSGYDFMNEVSALLHDPAGEAPLNALWEQVSGRSSDFHVEERIARIEILERTFPGQLSSTTAAFHRLALRAADTRDITCGMIRRALVGILTRFSSYRSYAGSRDDGAERLWRAADAARADAAPGEAEMPGRLVRWVLEASPDDRLARDAARRFEQLSAPLAAKAVEDTAFYRYGRLLSRTDVGFDPVRFSQTPMAFLDRVTERSRIHPDAMLATATHDHKRGEDVRARLAVLSERPAEWSALVTAMDAHADTSVAAADRYQIIQTIVGAWPLVEPDADFADRITAWSRKALREAKLRSSWTAPDEAYEERCASWIARLLADSDARRLLTEFVDLIAPAGAINALVQTILRYTLPGVPDCYQGTEFWDFSLVDPDNRRPVDYAARMPVASWPEAASLWASWRSGRIKQALIAYILTLKRDDPGLFSGPILPLQIAGLRADHILGFRRTSEMRELTIVLPMRCAHGLRGDGSLNLASDWLGDTRISGYEGDVPAAGLFAEMPVGVSVRSH